MLALQTLLMVKLFHYCVELSPDIVKSLASEHNTKRKNIMSLILIIIHCYFNIRFIEV